MKVLFVCNNVYTPGNGLSTSARVTTKRLREAGLDVRMLSADNPDPTGHQPDYKLKHFHFPIFQPIIDRNSFSFARDDMKVIREAVDWADVIHLEEPFFLESKAGKYARKTGKPCVGTYHLLSENIYYNIIPALGQWKLINAITTRCFRRVYDRCSDVQCPTQMVKERLEQFNFKARLHVISNGTMIRKEPEANKPQTKPYLVVMSGRYSAEKDPLVLLKAMEYSRHSGEIQLEFAGRGGLEKRMRREGERLLKEGVLKYRPKFGFYKAAELREMNSRAYLYVHCALVEVEGLGCLEAIREGVVPIISQGSLIATSQFALDERSLFPRHDAKALAERIDWWIEHPEERERMSLEYAKSACDYDVVKSIDGLIEMYKTAIAG
ncbi:MAG: glycosyltransferase [Bacteroidales bacterium]|nr:glycosyltransferase [Candidatus Hennigimonas equi]